MATSGTRYNAHDAGIGFQLGALAECPESSTMLAQDAEHDDATGVIIHVVPENKSGWTHIEDMDSFFIRMYRYYVKGGFYPMLLSDCLQLFQFCFVVWFSTFLVHCVNYPLLFRDDIGNRTSKITLQDVIYPTKECLSSISWQWWCIVLLCGVVWLIRLARSLYNLYFAYDTKLFYNHALKINDSDLAWINWHTVQTKVREAQQEHHMCVQKQQITELDIYHRILRFNNYLVAMVNKKLLPLHFGIPFVGDVPYLSKGLKYNLELLLFYGPWSPWENCWQLRECYKDASKRQILARELQQHITVMALLNLLLAPVIQAWQILYFFFSYAEMVKRSPDSLGLRTWSIYARILLRHFNELDHELSDRLTRAHKPATKYLASFPSPITTVIAKNIAFMTGSVLSVLILLTVYDEDVLTVEHLLTLITVLGCVFAIARGLINDEEGNLSVSAGEELLVQVLGHVHYLPADWRGKAHTSQVAHHFQQLFQFRAAYLVIELLSPILCPLMLYSLRSRALDIVDFYRNFTVSVLGVGDVCSFAQLDVRRHGNPEWQTIASDHLRLERSQYEQGEGGKTELSLVAFSHRNPGWKMPQLEQRKFIKSLRRSMYNAVNGASSYAHNNLANPRTMLGSYLQHSLACGANAGLPILSLYQHRSPFRLPNMDETSDEDDFDSEQPRDSEERASTGITHQTQLPTVLSQTIDEEESEMSVSTLHLYDIHLAQTSQQSTFSPQQSTTTQQDRPNIGLLSRISRQTSQTLQGSGEETPLLSKRKP